ncbi:MAG: hypothetical protein Q8N97_09335 [Methanobacteriaceae archaeon]|nr:hypothetical protein [Methanobacteriaceae archaeon]MDP3034313.1 hypothetical protein [Methanobacteriaceae archaeon]MDP3623531.1 hypothetical protein [Methanobacteriaceae archaeon]
MNPAKNTVRMMILDADSGVYLCIFCKLCHFLQNLKKTSIFHVLIYISSIH